MINTDLINIQVNMSIIDILKIIGAVAAVVGTSYSIWNSKGSILRRIERKEKKIRQIDHEIDVCYGLNRGSCHPISYLDTKREKLGSQIDSLQRLIQ